LGDLTCGGAFPGLYSVSVTVAVEMNLEHAVDRRADDGELAERGPEQAPMTVTANIMDQNARTARPINLRDILLHLALPRPSGNGWPVPRTNFQETARVRKRVFKMDPSLARSRSEK
jgi:hypothetical protein